LNRQWTKTCSFSAFEPDSPLRFDRLLTDCSTPFVAMPLAVLQEFVQSGPLRMHYSKMIHVIFIPSSSGLLFVLYGLTPAAGSLTPLGTLFPSCNLLKRNMEGHTLSSTREPTARSVSQTVWMPTYQCDSVLKRKHSPALTMSFFTQKPYVALHCL
jgi:hypothetical protein